MFTAMAPWFPQARIDRKKSLTRVRLVRGSATSARAWMVSETFGEASLELHRLEDTDAAKKQIVAGIDGWGLLPDFLLSSVISSQAIFAFRKSEAAVDICAGDRYSRAERIPIEGGYAVKRDDDVAELATFVSEQLLADPQRVYIIEDVLARRGDPYLQGLRCRTAYLDEAVFVIVDARVSFDELRECIFRSHFTFGHSLSFISGSSFQLHDTQLSTDDIEQVAQGAEWDHRGGLRRRHLLACTDSLKPADRFDCELSPRAGWEYDDPLHIFSDELARGATKAGLCNRR